MSDLRFHLEKLANWATVLITVGIIFRIGFGLWVTQNPLTLSPGDGAGYEQIARNLIEGHGFSMADRAPYAPDMLRTPGYPFFVVGIYAVVGYRPEIIALVQNILSLITIYIAYRLAVDLFGKNEALIAAILMLFDVGVIILANITFTEVLFMALFVTDHVEEFFNVFLFDNLR